MIFTVRESAKQFLESYIQDMMHKYDNDVYECTHQELVEDIQLYAESQDKHISIITTNNNSPSLDAQKKLEETRVVPESACDLKYAGASK